MIFWCKGMLVKRREFTLLNCKLHFLLIGAIKKYCPHLKFVNKFTHLKQSNQKDIFTSAIDPGSGLKCDPETRGAVLLKMVIKCINDA